MGKLGPIEKQIWTHDIPALYLYSCINDASTNGTDLYKAKLLDREI